MIKALLLALAVMAAILFIVNNAVPCGIDNCSHTEVDPNG